MLEALINYSFRDTCNDKESDVSFETSCFAGKYFGYFFKATEACFQMEPFKEF